MTQYAPPNRRRPRRVRAGDAVRPASLFVISAANSAAAGEGYADELAGSDSRIAKSPANTASGSSW